MKFTQLLSTTLTLSLMAQNAFAAGPQSLIIRSQDQSNSAGYVLTTVGDKVNFNFCSDTGNSSTCQTEFSTTVEELKLVQGQLNKKIQGDLILDTGIALATVAATVGLFAASKGAQNGATGNGGQGTGDKMFAGAGQAAGGILSAIFGTSILGIKIASTNQSISTSKDSVKVITLVVDDSKNLKEIRMGSLKSLRQAMDEIQADIL